jgi:parallel beta-helix repeat protein
VLLGVAGVAGLAALSRSARAGELSPPAGPISPTGVSLSQLDAKQGNMQATLSLVKQKVAATDQGVAEPRVPISSLPSSLTALYSITQPGAYCLTDNLPQPDDGRACIEVLCSDVDIDCQGFTAGFPYSSNPALPPSSFIRASGQSSIEVYDLCVSNWRGCPIDCDDCDDVYVSDCLFRQCTCPAGLNSDGTVSPGAMIRCRDRCEIDDVCVSLCDGCAVRVRDKSTVCDVRWSDCAGQACVCRDSCCIEELELVECAMAQGGGGGGGLLLARDGVVHRDLAARNCLCPDGLFTAGDNWVCEDACLTHITGDCVRCGDGCCVRDVDCDGCTGKAVLCGNNACVESMCVRTHQGDCVTVLDNGAVCDVECRSCTGVAITCGAGACVEEVAISNHTGDCVRCADGSCVTETECRNVVGVGISVGKSSVIEDCDVSGGGGGGSYKALEGSRVVGNRGVSRDDSDDIAVTDRCFVGDNIISRGVGISCGSECCVEDNQLTQCNGKPDSTAGVGAAIVVSGSHSSISDNQLTNCRVGISIRNTGHWSSVDDNHISSSIAPDPVSTVAGIVIDSSATGVLCTCNHLRLAPGSPPFIAGSSSYGPLVSLDPAGGDLSSQPLSAHHLANYIVP